MAVQKGILHLWLLLVVFVSCGLGFDLEGSQTSYAKFPVWRPCANGSIAFDFETMQPNGLLLYVDDGGKYDFMEVKLVGGVARLRFNLGEGTNILSIGHQLNDGRWHKVVVSRDNANTIFTVDNIVQRSTSDGEDFTFGNASSRAISFVYMGGLPIGFNSRLSQLALPSVMFEPRFRGNIRNVMYSNCGAQRTRVEMLEQDGVRKNNADECQDRDLCENNGICISTDTGSFCDCTHTDFVGQHCEIGESHYILDEMYL